MLHPPERLYDVTCVSEKLRKNENLENGSPPGPHTEHVPRPADLLVRLLRGYVILMPIRMPCPSTPR